MGVTDGVESVSAGVGGPRQHVGERRAPGRGRAGDILRIDSVDHSIERHEDLEPTRQSDGELGHEPGQRPDILH